MTIDVVKRAIRTKEGLETCPPIDLGSSMQAFNCWCNFARILLNGSSVLDNYRGRGLGLIDVLPHNCVKCDRAILLAVYFVSRK